MDDKEEKQGEREKRREASIQNTAGNELHSSFPVFLFSFSNEKLKKSFVENEFVFSLGRHAKIDLFFESEASFYCEGHGSTNNFN